MDYKEIKNCRVCGSDRLKKYLDLGKQPLSNFLLTSFKDKPKKYDLKLLFCEDCSLSQLSIAVNPEILYKNYPYHSSVSNTFKNHCREMAKQLKKMFFHPETYDGWDGPQDNPHSGKPIENLVMIDIASNDGCLIEQFKEEGFNVVGVEPSKNLADEANRKGLHTINAFWGDTEKSNFLTVDLITATNILAHVDDIHSFLSFSNKQLRSYGQGFMVVEVPYLKNLIESNQFDTVYHEHLSYFLLRPLKIAFEMAGMNVFRVEEVDIHGGSLRVFASPYNRTIEDSVRAILESEEKIGFYKFEKYKEYSKSVSRIKDDFLKLLNFLKNQGKRVMAYGASAKGINLMNICGINQTHIVEVVDDTFEKQGKIIPGCGIPVVGGDRFESTNPEYIALLSWNFSDELIQKTESHRNRGGKYIIPIPEVMIQ